MARARLFRVVVQQQQQVPLPLPLPLPLSVPFRCGVSHPPLPSPISRITAQPQPPQQLQYYSTTTRTTTTRALVPSISHQNQQQQRHSYHHFSFKGQQPQQQQQQQRPPPLSLFSSSPPSPSPPPSSTATITTTTTCTTTKMAAKPILSDDETKKNASTTTTTTTTTTTPACADRVAHFVQDVWSVFSPLAVKTNAANLGQGFPNFPPPEFIKKAAVNALGPDLNNQYAHPKGLLALRQQIAQTYSPLFGKPLDPESHIMVSAGANEGIFATLSAYLNPGDECIIMEPFFDQYEPNITLNGGVPVYVPLRQKAVVTSTSTTNGASKAAAATTTEEEKAEDWTLNLDELRSKITDRTRVIIVNTPHNPIGKVWSKEELLGIGQVAKEHNLLIISDEVYERLVYDKPHVRMASLSQDLWERTVTICSAGKTFAVTGWRLGWAIGAPSLIQNVLNAHTRIVFCANAPLQHAVAEALSEAQGNGYYDRQVEEYRQRRAKLLDQFRSLGLRATVPDGSYFVLVDTSPIRIPEDEWAATCAVPLPSSNRDWRVCHWLTTYIGVAAIPPSSFYSPTNAHLAENLARFCFCKTEETLNKAVQALEKLRKYIE